MKILVSSINFAPDHAGIGLYSTDFPVYMAEQGEEVTMVTGFPYYPSWKKNKEDTARLFKRDSHRGVKVLRGYLFVPSGKLNALRRLVHEFSFSFFAALNFMRATRPNVIVVFTPPIFLGLVGVLGKWRWRVPLVINIQDLPLDAALALGMIKPSLTSKLLQRLEDWIYRQADLVCSISPTMLANIRDKGVTEKRLALVPNWIDVDEASVAPPPGSFIVNHPEVAGKFIVAYAGNLGIKQGIDILVRVAKAIEREKDIHFFIIGEGADKNRLRQLALELEVRNLTFLPFQSHQDYQAMLSDVDVVFVAQRSGAGNNFFPSKLLGLMARSKPLLIAADHDSELARVITESNSGLISAYEDVEQIAKNIQAMREMGSEIDKIGENGRRAVMAFDRKTILAQWRSTIQKIVAKDAR